MGELANACYSQIFQTWLRAVVKPKGHAIFYQVLPHLVCWLYLLQQGDLQGLKGKDDENVESVRFPTNILLVTLLL